MNFWNNKITKISECQNYKIIPGTKSRKFEPLNIDENAFCQQLLALIKFSPINK